MGPQYGVTALMLASVAGHTDTVHVLLSAGAHVDLQNKVRCSTHITVGALIRCPSNSASKLVSKQ